MNTKSIESGNSVVYDVSYDETGNDFDILQISRLALEELEARRIGAAYTEKSQRYITLKGDFVIPKEFNKEDAKKFRKLVEFQNEFYLQNLDKLTKYQFESNPELAGQAQKAIEKGTSEKMNRAKNTLEGWAKALELRDSDTEGHTRRVANLAISIGKKMGLRE